MKAQVKLLYNNQEYFSNLRLVTPSELKKIQQTIDYAVSGKLESLELENGNQNYHFPKEIVLQSIITIIKHD